MRDIDEPVPPMNGADPADADFEAGLAAHPGIALLEDLNRTIDVLEEIVERETQLLRAGDMAQVTDLQDAKSEAAALYQRQAGELLSQATFLGGENNPFRAQLVERTQALRQVMAANRTALNASKAARFHRIEAVMQALRDQLASDSTYTPEGGLTTERPRRRPVLNRSFNAKI